MPNFTKRHPDTSYDTHYPYNRVTVTESGHELHWDDTKGHERVRFAHMSGSYFEMSPGGRRVDLTVGHQVNYAKGGMTITSDRNMDRKVHGSIRSSTGGHEHRETKGDHTHAIGLDQKDIIGRNKVSATGGNETHGTVGDYLAHVGGSYRRKTDGWSDVKVGADSLHHTAGTHTIWAHIIILRASAIILESSDIRLGGWGASLEVAMRGSYDDDNELNGPNQLVGGLSNVVRTY